MLVSIMAYVAAIRHRCKLVLLEEQWPILLRASVAIASSSFDFS